MSSQIKFLLVSFVIFVIQILASNYLNINVYIYLFIIPYIILSLPFRYKTISVMIISFLAGIVIDFTCDNIIGLNAAALTAMAFTRHFLLSRLVNEKNVDKNDYPSITVMGVAPYLAYILFSLTFFFLVYIPLETFSFRPFLFQFLRCITGISINTILILILSVSIKFRRS